MRRDSLKTALEPGSLFAAVASVAKVAHEVSLDKPDSVVLEDEDALFDRTTPDEKLAAVLEVNRMLHSAVLEKKEMLKKSHEEIEALRKRTDSQSVEEPARRSHIDELHVRMQEFEAESKGGRDARIMAREIQRLEAKISMLNEDNLVLAEKHRLDRVRVVEQQGRLRTLAKRERELTKSLDFLATQLNEEIIARSFGEHGESVEFVLPQLQMVDYRNLPGMHLNKLVGRHPQREPPTVVVPPGSSMVALALLTQAGSPPIREEPEVREESDVRKEQAEAVVSGATMVGHEGGTNGSLEKSLDDSVPEEMAVPQSS